MLGGLVIGVGTGALGGLYLSERRAGDSTVALHLFGVVAICAPAAVTAYDFVFFLDVTGKDLCVPCLALALPIPAAVMRVSAGATRDALSDDAVRTAYSKGLRLGRVLRRHVLIFAVPPISAYGGASVNLIVLNAAI